MTTITLKNIADDLHDFLLDEQSIQKKQKKKSVHSLESTAVKLLKDLMEAKRKKNKDL